MPLNGFFIDWSLLFTSTRPAMPIETIDKTSPKPTLCSWVIPVGWPVIFLANGMKKNSYSGSRMAMKTRGITGIEGGGIFHEPNWGSMKYPWSTEKVCSCAKHVFIMMVLAMIGSIRISILTSSTCVTVQILPDLGIVSSLRTAALSRNLDLNKINEWCSSHLWAILVLLQWFESQKITWTGQCGKVFLQMDLFLCLQVHVTRQGSLASSSFCSELHQ